MTVGTREPGVGGDGPAAAPVRFNPFTAGFRRDPYPLYRRLRETNPASRSLGMWVLTRHADVQEVLRDATFSADLIPQLVSRQARRDAHDIARIERLAKKSLVFTDNPDHARLRGLVNRVFSAQAIATLRPAVTAVAERLLQTAWDAGGMDAVADLAAPLPVTVLCDWMALPDGLRACAGRWTHEVRFLLEPGLMKPGEFAHVSHVVDEFAGALDEVVAERRSRPGDDLVSRLLAARTGSGDRLTDEEVVFVCLMCFVAGTETTKALIGNGLLALLQHPAQDALLRGDVSLAGGAVDEALRFDSPLQMTKRLATRDTGVGGARISDGDQVLLCLAAANRDPAVFDRPDEFDITRDTKRHLAFGHGMHGCLGGSLARLQAQVVLELVYRRPERLRLLDEQPQWQDHSFILRGVARLPVAVDGRS